MDFSRYPVTLLLIAANVIFSLAGFYNKDLLNRFIGWPFYEKHSRQYYRMITSGFLHADWAHLFFNMFTLYFFGRNVELIFTIGGLGGEFAYIALYFLGMIAADLPGYFKHGDDEYYRSLGASGAVSAVVFSTIVFDPWGSIYIYGAIKLSMVFYAVLYLIYCVYAGRQQLGNINHDAHLWGSLFGLVFTLALVGILRSDVFPYIIEEMKQPSISGRSGPGEVLEYLLSTR